MKRDPNQNKPNVDITKQPTVSVTSSKDKSKNTANTQDTKKQDKST